MRKILTASLLLLLLPLTSCFEDKPDAQAEEKKPSVVEMGEMAEGDENAKVVVLEYSSMSCPHCADFNKRIYPDFKKKYIETGKVKFVHRDFPLNAPALRASQLLHCVGKEKFYVYRDILFEQQENWAFKQNFLEELENIAKLGGMKGSDFTACVDNKALEDRIIKDAEYANQVMGIEGTPTFFVNGQKFKLPDFIEFEKSIDPLLK